MLNILSGVEKSLVSEFKDSIFFFISNCGFFYEDMIFFIDTFS